GEATGRRPGGDHEQPCSLHRTAPLVATYATSEHPHPRVLILWARGGLATPTRLAQNAPIAQLHDAMAARGRDRTVGHEDDGQALLTVERLDQIEDALTGA